jgi:hypothetical protein
VSNTLLTIDKITSEALRLAHEKAAFLGTINRQFDNSWSGEGKTGDTLRIRIPSAYTRRQGSRVMDVQDSTQQSTSLVRATQDGVDMRFNSRELSLDLDNFSKLHLEPAMAVLVSGIESDVLQGVTKKVWNVAGTAGTAPSDLAAVGAARAKLNQSLAPKDGNRFIQMDSVTMGTLVNGLKGLFQDSQQIKEQYREGMVGRTAMADFYENERVYSHTNQSSVAHTTGTLNGPTLVNGLATVTTATGGLPTVGSVFTVAGIYQCHPETKAAYTALQQFTVTATNSASTMTISPALYISGPRQNVSAANGSQLTSTSNVTSAAITWVGDRTSTYAHNLMYHRDAFTFATAALPIYGAAEKCVVKTFDGISLRVWQDADIRNDELLTRIDILYGFATIRPQWACRITS